MNFYNIVDKCILADLSFALYSLPDEDKIMLVVDKHKAKKLCFDDLVYMGEGFVFHAFNNSDKYPLWFIESSYVITSEDSEYSAEFIKFINSKPSKSRKDIALDVDINKSDYLNKLNDLINLLNESSLEKLVYSRTTTVENKGINCAVDIFKKLESNYEDAFVFFVNISDEIAWIGASPELLLSLEEDSMHTMALAGTKAFCDEDVIDVDWGAKEIKEQKYVSDYISDELDKLKCNYEIGQVRTVKAANVCHLQSIYTIDIDNDNYWSIVKSLHPTPAVCGIPAKEAADYIDKIEDHDRSYYSGFLGPLNIFNNTRMFVNLRSARIYSNSMQLYIGGGITADSIAHKEWDETELKSKTILNIL